MVLYVASQFAHALGDFCFFVFLGNDLILFPLVSSKFGKDAKALFEKGVNITKEKVKLVFDKLPKYSDLKKN